MRVKPRNPQEALEHALDKEGVNYCAERAVRIFWTLVSLGFEVTARSNWQDREPQTVSLVQDEI